jgi:hypothetical protein
VRIKYHCNPFWGCNDIIRRHYLPARAFFGASAADVAFCSSFTHNCSHFVACTVFTCCNVPARFDVDNRVKHWYIFGFCFYRIGGNTAACWCCHNLV